MKIILATGGSGGHIFPALKTAEELKKKGHEVFFAGALSSAEGRLHQAGFSYRILNVEGFSVRTIGRFIWLMTKAIAQSKKIIRSLEPDAVVGFGSYSSFPVLWVASMSKIPTMIHEQNVIPGKANRVSGRFVDQIAVSFQETRNAFPRRKILWTGCPCHDKRPQESKADILQSFGLRGDRKTILVLGGSQGSHFLNEVFFESIPYLGNIQVIHATGKTDEPVYIQKYSSLEVPYHVCAFLNNIEHAYAVADLVIGRAGAATVYELASFGLPAILIPYPFAHNHQAANAAVLQNAGVAFVIEQKNMSRQKLIDAVQRIINEKLTRSDIHKRLDGCWLSHPTEQLIKAVESMKS